MKGLYEIYNYVTDQPCGQLWLGREERERLLAKRTVQLVTDDMDGRMLMVTPEPIAMDTMRVYSVALCLDMPRRGTGEWRVYCLEGVDNLDRLKTAQEAKMRFPVPLSVFPG